MLLLYTNRPIFEVTWTGDTHKETDILPSNGLEQRWLLKENVQDKTSLIVKEMVDTRLSLIGEGQEW